MSWLTSRIPWSRKRSIELTVSKPPPLESKPKPQGLLSTLKSAECPTEVQEETYVCTGLYSSTQVLKTVNEAISDMTAALPATSNKQKLFVKSNCLANIRICLGFVQAVLGLGTVLSKFPAYSKCIVLSGFGFLILLAITTAYDLFLSNTVSTILKFNPNLKNVLPKDQLPLVHFNQSIAVLSSVTYETNSLRIILIHLDSDIRKILKKFTMDILSPLTILREFTGQKTLSAAPQDPAYILATAGAEIASDIQWVTDSTSNFPCFWTRNGSHPWCLKADVPLGLIFTKDGHLASEGLHTILKGGFALSLERLAEDDKKKRS